MKTILKRSFIIALTALLLVIAAFSAYKVYSLSGRRAEIKRDYGLLNNISYGLLSVNAWRDHMVRVRIGLMTSNSRLIKKLRLKRKSLRCVML